MRCKNVLCGYYLKSYCEKCVNAVDYNIKYCQQRKAFNRIMNQFKKPAGTTAIEIIKTVATKLNNIKSIIDELQ